MESCESREIEMESRVVIEKQTKRKENRKNE